MVSPTLSLNQKQAMHFSHIGSEEEYHPFRKASHAIFDWSVTESGIAMLSTYNLMLTTTMTRSFPKTGLLIHHRPIRDCLCRHP